MNWLMSLTSGLRLTFRAKSSHSSRVIFWAAPRVGAPLSAERRCNDDEVDELIGVFNQEIMTGFPDTFGFAGRDPIFGGSRGGRMIEIDLSANSFDSLLEAGRAGFFAVLEALPEANVRPVPGLEMAEPEIRLIPDDRKIAEAGWNRVKRGDRSAGHG